MTATVQTGPVQVTGEVLSVKKAGAYQHLTMVAPGIAERFRPGTFVTVAVGGPLSSATLRRSLPVHRVRPTGAYGGTVECVFAVDDAATAWLAAAPAGTPLDVVGPLGRPYALPKEPVTCVLVGDGCASAPLFPLAERLRERSCVVHMLLGATTESALFGALEARRATRGVVVTTAAVSYTHLTLPTTGSTQPRQSPVPQPSGTSIAVWLHAPCASAARATPCRTSCGPPA